MATMVVQFGLATMPFRIDASAAALTSGTTSGTSGSIRQADELSMTTAPPDTNLGASCAEAEAPMENRARSRPSTSAVAASSTTTSRPRKGIRRPADRDEANSLRSSSGNPRSSRMASITVPT